MTRAVRDRILKDANGDISDHLRNHIHLTNCIHLKNHMHKHSPMLHERSLMRDLMVLQRSRSLRDPSASPPSWQSPLGTDLHTKSGEVVSFIGRRMSTGVDRRKIGRKVSRSSPQQDSAAASIVEAEKKKATGGRSSMSSSGSGEKHAVEGPHADENGNELLKSQVLEKTLTEQLSDVPGDGDDVASSNIQLHEGASEKVEPSGRASSSGINRVRRNKFRRMKRTQASAPPKEKRSLSVASNSSTRAIGQQGYRIQEQEEDNVTRIPRNGCGIPWNWSRIHHRSKSFFDMAGKSLSCGLSDSRLKRGGSMSHGRDMSDFPKASGGPSSCSESDAEAAPLLVDGYGSQETGENAAWEHDYSGELGIYANSLLRQETDSDFASDSKLKHGVHQSLTQKYMPRSFRDLVGQNLVVQALSNAVVRRKMALLYVFHGPHGTGKTSCARILARALNCMSREHPKPCGSCSSCITHDLGKSRSIKEIGSVSNLDFESIMDLLDNMMMVSQQGSQYKVFIFDDCDTLSADCWSAISKVIDRAPRRVVFMLICSSLDILPHAIISRCQKFFFPKLKDADIIYALQWIATKEGLEIDKDALKLIASRSDGSLRDAEMTLEQLSLLGQRISVSLVQELIGLISDEKLVELLDLALSADTVNTVKNLREVMETGVEPLALMSQLATVITDILAGSYDFMKSRHRRKFFKQPTLAKEDMEKLRQALKTLSEAEKQMRTSNDKLTWLTAALLQLAPDKQYMLPSSSADTSFIHSPLLNDKARRQAARKSDLGQSVTSYGRGLDSRSDRLHAGNCCDVHSVTKFNASSVDKRKHASSRVMSQQISSVNAEAERVKGRKSISKSCSEIDEIWLDVLDKIQISCIKEFLYQEGKLVSVSYSTAPSVRLGFSSYQTKTKAEKFREYILQAFEYTFGCPVLIEMRTESRKDVSAGANAPVIVPTFEAGSFQINMKSEFNSDNCVPLYNDSKQGTGEIVEVAITPSRTARGNPEHSRIVLAGASQKLSNMASQSEKKPRELNQCRSIIRSKVSLADVIQQAEGSTSQSSWTKRKAVSIAEKLEQENMRLEPRTRSLLAFKEHEREIPMAIDVLKHQSWLSLFATSSKVSPTLVRKFYKLFTPIPALEASDPSATSSFRWDDEDHILGLRTLGKILNLNVNKEGLRISQKRNSTKGSRAAIPVLFGEAVRKRKPKGPLFVKDLPIHLRIVYSFLVTNINPRSKSRDRVNLADSVFLWEVLLKRPIDTPQIVLYSMQCSIGNTKEGLVLPNLISPILKSLDLSTNAEDWIDMSHAFLPEDLCHLIVHGDLMYVSPPPSPVKQVKGPSPRKPESPRLEAPSFTIGSRPGLRSGNSLLTIQLLEVLNSKMDMLVESSKLMVSNSYVMVSLAKEMVQIFKDRPQGVEEVSREQEKCLSAEEKRAPKPSVVGTHTIFEDSRDEKVDLEDDGSSSSDASNDGDNNENEDEVSSEEAEEEEVEQHA